MFTYVEEKETRNGSFSMLSRLREVQSHFGVVHCTAPETVGAELLQSGYVHHCNGSVLEQSLPSTENISEEIHCGVVVAGKVVLPLH